MKTNPKSLLAEKHTQSTRVAIIIERNIAEGILPPGSKLKSERELAAEFHVSQKVIFNAKNILERKNLIIRKPKKGVFVRSPEIGNGMKEILIFAMDQDPANNFFVQKMLELMRSPSTHGKLNFSVRLVGTGTGNSWGNLKQELQRLEQSALPDCAILLTMGFLRRDVEQALQLPFPVIFAGDFIEGDYDDLNYIRIAATSNASNRLVVDYAAAKGFKKIVYLFPGKIYTPEILTYFKDFSEKARAANIHVETLQIHIANLNEVTQQTQECLRRNRDMLETCDLLVSRYFKIPDPGFTLPMGCYMHDMPQDHLARQVRQSYEKMYREICNVIFNLKDYKGKRKIITTDTDATLIESKTEWDARRLK